MRDMDRLKDICSALIELIDSTYEFVEPEDAEYYSSLIDELYDIFSEEE